MGIVRRRRGKKFCGSYHAPLYDLHRFKDRFTIRVDKSYQDEEYLCCRDAHYVIPCHKGGKVSKEHANIYAHSLMLLGYIGKGLHILKKMRLIPSVRVHQVGDQEFSVIFPPSALEQVIKIVKPFKTRVGTPRISPNLGVKKATFVKQPPKTSIERELWG
jgi:hypothetical protein